MTSQELATAVENEEMDFTEALLLHLEHNFPALYDVAPFFVMSMAISYANMRSPNTILTLHGEDLTSQEIIDRFDLRPFVVSTEK